MKCQYCGKDFGKQIFHFEYCNDGCRDAHKLKRELEKLAKGLKGNN